MNLLHVVGARPNFMKVAPVMAALAPQPTIRQTLVDTGQHYDTNMSEIFFRQLEIPPPDVNLGVGSGSHAWQTAEIMIRLEPVLLEHGPDLVLVYGDVNSTVAATLVCAKLLIPVGHVEAGLRSHDRSMPEEINRLVTDQLSELLFTHSADANENLLREGIAPEKVHLVGNVMIDTLVRCLSLCKAPPLDELPDAYALVTLHRPSNVDDVTVLAGLMRAIEDIAEDLPVLFPVHPRTRRVIDGLGTLSGRRRLHLMDPLGYLEFLWLQQHARLVISDSGGVQEETTFLGIPCLTVRENTERMITLTLGTNVLVGRDPDRLRCEARRVLNGHTKPGGVPPLWDGGASDRIASIVESWGKGERS
jgi:UDP-N-acetylglucosamine 2-epimerase (non-hydrolysing)